MPNLFIFKTVLFDFIWPIKLSKKASDEPKLLDGVSFMMLQSPEKKLTLLSFLGPSFNVIARRQNRKKTVNKKICRVAVATRYLLYTQVSC